MEKLVQGILALANLAALFILFDGLRGGRATELPIVDLRPGAVDIDGDGRYTFGDDWVLQYDLENRPHLIEEGLKTARRNPDGGIDPSPYSLSPELEGINRYRARFQENEWARRP